MNHLRVANVSRRYAEQASSLRGELAETSFWANKNAYPQVCGDALGRLRMKSWKKENGGQPGVYTRSNPGMGLRAETAQKTKMQIEAGKLA